ncbi:MAG: ankyrin repeat domain-containing protein [Rubrivivax sp.]|jgi:hypothetical protein|nr:ankyrin repeat domain-containing protein [Rubrivivax sp.]
MNYTKKIIQILLVIASFPAFADAYQDFFRALARDDARTVGSLLSRGFDPNARSEKGQGALHLALQEGSLQVAAALIAAPSARIDEPNASGETPLMIALLHGHLDAAQALLARGAAVTREGWAPLHYAAAGPEPRAVALMLGRGAPIDARAPNGSTALMMAASYGAIDSAEMLLARGADARLRNGEGLDAADFARQAGRDRLAERLRAAAPR